MFIAQFYKKTATFHVLRVVTLRHFELKKNKWADLKNPAVRLKVTVRAVLDLRTLFEEHVFLFFFDSLEVHFCPEKIWAHPLKNCPIQAASRHLCNLDVFCKNLKISQKV